MNLISRIADGDKEAFEKLFLLYRTKVFRVALAILKDPFLAEDVMQETALRIHETAKTYQFKNSEREWIMTIARNIAIDTLRKRQKEIVQGEITIGNETTAAETDSNINDGFLQLIEPLSETDKQIVSLHLIGELKHREIAHILNMNVATVKKRYERAIKKIAQEMEEKHE